MTNLTPKQQQFVQEYLIDLNATQAAIRAGYSKKTAYSQGQRLLKNVEIAKFLDQARSERAARTGITADYVLNQAVKLHERCMQEVTPLTDRTGQPRQDEAGRPLYVFNATGAAKALELIGKHVTIRAFRDQIGVSNPTGGPIEITETPASEQLKAFLAQHAAKTTSL